MYNIYIYILGGIYMAILKKTVQKELDKYKKEINIYKGNSNKKSTITIIVNQLEKLE